MNDVMRSEYRTLTADEKATLLEIKTKGYEFYSLLASISGSREMTIALTKVEEAVMWSTKAVTA